MNRTICFLTDAFISDPRATITGPMVQTYLLGKALLNRGWNVHYISFSKSGNRGMENFEGLNVHWLPYRNFSVLPQYFDIQKLLKIIRPGFCYQRGRDPLTGIAARYCRRHSAVFTWASAGESGVLPLKYRNALAQKKKSIFKKCLLYPLAFIHDVITEYGIRKAHHIIVQTDYQRNQLREQFGRDSTVIKSGHPVPEPVQRNLPLKILWIGSIKPVKQPELFIRLAELCSTLSCEFIMAGQIPDPDYQNEILKKVQSVPNLRYTGPVPFHESQSLISGAHILVNTTVKDYEGLPNAFVQAWLTGTVTASLESDPDGVIESHLLGIRAGSLEKLHEFIRQIHDYPEKFETYSRNAREFAVKHFSIDSIATQVENLIRYET